MGSWSPDASIIGGAQTSFTSPTFALVADTAPNVNGKQVAVSALGGTQGNATANSISSPFTATFSKPVIPKTVPPVNPLTGARGTVPNNKYKLVIRKGGYAAADTPVIAIARLEIDIPAGMDAYNPDNVRSLVSFLVGILSEESADLGDTVVTGVLS